MLPASNHPAPAKLQVLACGLDHSKGVPKLQIICQPTRRLGVVLAKRRRKTLRRRFPTEVSQVVRLPRIDHRPMRRRLLRLHRDRGHIKDMRGTTRFNLIGLGAHVDLVASIAALKLLSRYAPIEKM